MVTTASIPSLGLDGLAALSYPALAETYATGTVPRSLTTLDGPLPGRLLRVRGARGIGFALRRWAASESFVWNGKTFAAEGDRAGTGINRVRTGGVLGRQNLFPFLTRFGDSLVDGKPTVILDYSSADNPFWIRPIHDEVRLVSPGLYLGPAMWKVGEGAVTVLWFGLDARR